MGHHRRGGEARGRVGQRAKPTNGAANGGLLTLKGVVGVCNSTQVLDGAGDASPPPGRVTLGGGFVGGGSRASSSVAGGRSRRLFKPPGGGLKKRSNARARTSFMVIPLPRCERHWELSRKCFALGLQAQLRPKPIAFGSHDRWSQVQ